MIISNNAPGAGGGLAGGSSADCIYQNNSSWWGAGADNATLNNCLLISNSAIYIGGGAISCQLNNCTLIGNSAGTGGGGGANSSTLYNCIVYYNSASDGSNYAYSTLNFCCASPDPGGTGNLTNAPVFVDQGGGNFRLSANSVCINSGNNAYVSGTNDLDGNSRIKGSTVDIGAYELQDPTSVISYAWLQQFGLVNDGTADYADADQDGMNNWQEWVAGTVPTNANSNLRLQSLTQTGGVTVTWSSVTNRSYFVERSTNLNTTPPFFVLKSNIAGLAATTSFVDSNPPVASPTYYRVGVQR